MADLTGFVFPLTSGHYALIGASLGFNMTIMGVIAFYCFHIRFKKMVYKNFGVFVINSFYGSLVSNIVQIIWYVDTLRNGTLSLDGKIFEMIIYVLMVYGVFVMRAAALGVILQRLLATFRLKDFYPNSPYIRCFLNTMFTVSRKN